MTFDLAVQLLEALKDHINDDGKRELAVVQKAILEWETLGCFIIDEAAAPPAPAPPQEPVLIAKKIIKKVSLKGKKKK